MFRSPLTFDAHSYYTWRYCHSLAIHQAMLSDCKRNNRSLRHPMRGKERTPEPSITEYPPPLKSHISFLRSCWQPCIDKVRYFSTINSQTVSTFVQAAHDLTTRNISFHCAIMVCPSCCSWCRPRVSTNVKDSFQWSLLPPEGKTIKACTWRDYARLL